MTGAAKRKFRYKREEHQFVHEENVKDLRGRMRLDRLDRDDAMDAVWDTIKSSPGAFQFFALRPVIYRGVYIMYGLDTSHILYVGKSNNIMYRVATHKASGVHWMQYVGHVQVIHMAYAEDDEITKMETMLIRGLKPEHNMTFRERWRP